MLLTTLSAAIFELFGGVSLHGTSHGCQHLVRQYTMGEQKAIASELRQMKNQYPAIAWVVVDYKAMRDACRQ
jgi:hypothetical protein